MTFALIGVGILCIVYGLVVFLAASGTWFFVVWFVLGAIFLGCAWATHNGWLESMPIVLKRIIEVGLTAILVVFLASQAFIMRDFNDKGEDGLDFVIVLGAQVREDGPSVALQYRLDKAIEYLTRNDNTICIVSGGQNPNEPTSEANVMADYLIARGIDPGRIAREDQSTNTDENIVFSKAFLDPAHSKVGILTNNFHVFRGVTIARKEGYENVCGIAADSSKIYLPNNLLRESLAIVKDLFTGHML